MTSDSQPGRYRVTLRFTADDNGPAASGYWTDPHTAQRAYRSWIGTHGSTTVRIQLTEQTARRSLVLASWTRSTGEVTGCPRGHQRAGSG
ncbi:hypothetical protein [Streptomyces natalensis]|uniref:hypothetical protein n=1 Tax=Streptomyces natalensis TaxID=68242 RepID=UPI00068FB60E|nr:hypothetical protein [Streptomyces natalensis]